MGKTIDAIASALTEIRPAKVLAISDYGAQLSDGTGITMIFHYLEEQFRRLPSTVAFLRSAEHMQNWARVIKVASETGVLPSLHRPVSKRFPTVSAQRFNFAIAQMISRLEREKTDRQHSSKNWPFRYVLSLKGMKVR
jgi:NAD(P)H dehydrogenase (quinone)